MRPAPRRPTRERQVRGSRSAELRGPRGLTAAGAASCFTHQDASVGRHGIDAEETPARSRGSGPRPSTEQLLDIAHALHSVPEEASVRAIATAAYPYYHDDADAAVPCSALLEPGKDAQALDAVIWGPAERTALTLVDLELSHHRATIQRNRTRASRPNPLRHGQERGPGGAAPKEHAAPFRPPAVGHDNPSICGNVGRTASLAAGGSLQEEGLARGIPGTSAGSIARTATPHDEPAIPRSCNRIALGGSGRQDERARRRAPMEGHRLLPPIRKRTEPDRYRAVRGDSLGAAVAVARRSPWKVAERLDSAVQKPPARLSSWPERMDLTSLGVAEADHHPAIRRDRVGGGFRVSTGKVHERDKAGHTRWSPPVCRQRSGYGSMPPFWNRHPGAAHGKDGPQRADAGEDAEPSRRCTGAGGERHHYAATLVYQGNGAGS
jgi:hypothetical protein